ncbi:MAG: porin [Phycisphaerae bacterium]|nr:porin [Gemmatimonadaceae bacterium]
MNRYSALGIVAAIAPVALLAQGSPVDTTTRITWGAFVDGYYAWDFQQPGNFDRSFAGGALFTTQPARHNEFNINLAFVEAKLDGQRVRGRIALQTGTSVQSNYSGEPANGQVSGPSLSRHIQEAVVGAKIAENVWVDGGIFFSHMGMEGWLSRDNPTYTRSLVAEYSPYYQSGAKLTWAATPKLTAQVNVVNGWQNISENNRGKGLGIRLDFAPMANSTLSYYNFFSQEAGTKLRSFNGMGGKVTKGRATVLAQFDLGMQDDSDGSDGSATWYGFTAIVRGQIAPTVSLSARVERFDDENQVIIATGALDDTPNAAFRGNGASVGLDWSPQGRLLWRTELRGFMNDRAVFQDGTAGTLSKRSAFVVSSLALTF